MQTYTHVGIGLVIWRFFFLGDILTLILITAGVVAVDIPNMIKFVWDKFVKGVEPFSHYGKRYVFFNDSFHSLTSYWLLSFICWPFFIGAYSHVILDSLSHDRKEGEKADPSWVWPLDWLVKKVLGIKIKLRIGLFDYRTKGVGKFITPLDTIVSIICFLVGATALI